MDSRHHEHPLSLPLPLSSAPNTTPSGQSGSGCDRLWWSTQFLRALFVFQVLSQTYMTVRHLTPWFLQSLPQGLVQTSQLCAVYMCFVMLANWALVMYYRCEYSPHMKHDNSRFGNSAALNHKTYSEARTNDTDNALWRFNEKCHTEFQHADTRCSNNTPPHSKNTTSGQDGIPRRVRETGQMESQYLDTGIPNKIPFYGNDTTTDMTYTCRFSERGDMDIQHPHLNDHHEIQHRHHQEIRHSGTRFPSNTPPHFNEMATDATETSALPRRVVERGHTNIQDDSTYNPPSPYNDTLDVTEASRLPRRHIEWNNTEPQHANAHNMPASHLNTTIDVTEKGGLPWKYCQRCQMEVPPRTVHCAVCNVCVLRRDHHCFLVGLCVGHWNQRFFVVLASYVMAAGYLGACLTLPYLYHHHHPHDSWWNYCLPVTLCKWLCGNLSSHLMVLTFHVYMCCLFGPIGNMYFFGQMLVISMGKTKQEVARKTKVKVTSSVVSNFRLVFGDCWWVNFLYPAHVMFPQTHRGLCYDDVKLLPD